MKGRGRGVKQGKRRQIHRKPKLIIESRDPGLSLVIDRRMIEKNPVKKVVEGCVKIVLSVLGRV